MGAKFLDQTAAIRAGAKAPISARTVNAPVQRGSTVLMPNAASLYEPGQVSYGRAGLQPHAALIEALCELEGATVARLFPNGVAAMSGAMMALLNAGDDVLVVDCIYDPTRRFCNKVLARFGVTTRYFHPSLSAEEVLALAVPATRMIVLESPGSLTFEIQDVPGIAALARARGILTVIDNTWGAAGLTFKPIGHGVDISVQSLTKYVGGHSDVFMGAALARDAALGQKLDEVVWQMGWGVSPDDAYLMLRGLRTLPTRLERHAASTLDIAAWLQAQPEVMEVICPALPGSRGHALWRRDFLGGNGLLTVVLTPKAQNAVYALLDALRLFGLGFSWGGFESLAIHCDPQLKRRSLDWTYPGPLVRFHVGLEAIDDLKADLRQALDAYAAA